MNFLERLFGISLDAGDGSFERLLLLVIVAVAAVLAVSRTRLPHRR